MDVLLGLVDGLKIGTASVWTALVPIVALAVVIALVNR